MKVKMLVSMAGAEICRKPGDVIEVSDRIGKAWIKEKIAAAINEQRQPVKPAERKMKI